MNIVERKIDKLGRIVLPMDFRKALGLEGEVSVVLGIDDNAITVKRIDNTCKLCGSIHDATNELHICSDCIKKIKNII